MDSTSYRNNRSPQRPVNPEPIANAAPVQQPQHVAAPAATLNAQPVAQPTHSTRKRSHNDKEPKSKRKFGLAALVIGLILALASGWYVLSHSGGAAASIDGSKYQAVFFTNGQVYFGKLSQQGSGYLKLKDVYYLQNKSKDSDDDSSPQSAKKQDASDVELIKLGNEIHGPEDEMLISKEQVLFFENLKPAGTVSQTIKNYQSKSGS